MGSDNITITLPFSETGFWIGVITPSVLALSWLAFQTAGKRTDENRLPSDWQMTSLRGFAGIMAPIWVALLILTMAFI